MHTCPKGHNSTEGDFCSECGAKIAGSVTESTANAIVTTPVPMKGAFAISAQLCPECSTPHEADSGSFCEICGYNFLTGAKGGDPLSSFPPPVRLPNSSLNTAPTQRPTPTITPPTLYPKSISKWEIEVAIDPSLATPDSPPVPTQAPMTIELNHPTNLIGRTSQVRAIYPEIPLDLDDAVSSRHAILTLHPDGNLVLRDIGSSNGTMVNGREIAIMADISISSGDEITLGHWTRIKLIKIDN
jgi:FHA domain